MRLGLLVLALIVACGPDVVAESGGDGSGSTGASTGTGSPDPGGPDPGSPGTTTEATPEPPLPTTSTTSTASTTTEVDTDDSTSSTTEAAIDCREIVLADPGLEAAIRKELALPEGPITADAAQSLTSISSYLDIDSFSGLECFPNLESLGLQHAHVSDLSPLAGLSQLRTLSIPGAQVSDLGPLAGLPHLEFLRLDDNPIASFAPLAGAPLRQIEADRIPAAAIAGLGQIGTLTLLSLADCGLADIGELAPLVGLMWLGLDDNHITDLSPLAGFTALKTLQAANNKIADVSPLAGLPALRALHLRDNLVSDVTALAMTDLQVLDLAGNQVVDITPLVTTSKLHSLDLSHNPLAFGLDGFAAHPALTHVDLGATGLTTIPGFSPAILGSLLAANNQITDLSGLAQYQVLHAVDLQHNAITDLAPIVDDPWLSECDIVIVADNPLSLATLEQVAPGLCAFPIDLRFPGLAGCDDCLVPP